jgi:hypothetical protein
MNTLLQTLKRLSALLKLQRQPQTQSTSSSSKRKAYRVPCNAQLQICFGGQTRMAQFRNITTGGARIHSKTSLPLEVPLKATVQRGSKKQEFDFQIQWKEAIAGGYVYGIAERRAARSGKVLENVTRDLLTGKIA